MIRIVLFWRIRRLRQQFLLRKLVKGSRSLKWKRTIKILRILERNFRALTGKRVSRGSRSWMRNSEASKEKRGLGLRSWVGSGVSSFLGRREGRKRGMNSGRSFWMS